MNWRVPTKMVASLLIPVVVALAFAGLRVRSSYNDWRTAADAEQTARLVRSATEVIYNLEQELAFSLGPILAGHRDDPKVLKLYAASDQSIQQFLDQAGNAPDVGHLQERLAQVRQQLPQLAKLRETAFQSSGSTTVESLFYVTSGLFSLANEMTASAGSNITSDARAIYALSLTKGSVANLRTLVTQLLLEPDTPANQAGRRQLVIAAFGFGYTEKVAEGEFLNDADARNRQDYQNALAALQAKSKAMVQQAAAAAAAAHKPFVAPPPLDQMVAYVGQGLSRARLAQLGVTPDTVMASGSLLYETLHSVETRLTDRAVTNAANAAGSAKQDAITNAVLVLVALLVAGLFTALVARSMIRGTKTLRNSAQDIATTRLPDLVRRLSKTDPDRVDTTVKPIPVSGRDEIAEVARAFDEVHREAVRLAAEQALMRGNVNAIFTNLSRRTQGLLTRLLDLISELERREADPDQLAHLFRLDHLVTRMRRNGENLLVLAGEEPDRRLTDPVPLVDVVRAALSEVEQYERIALQPIPALRVTGPVVTDLIHLIAELLENATTYSGPQTDVTIGGTPLPDGRVLLEIQDQGIGLTPDDLLELNAKLTDPPLVDVSVSRRMGLFVVSRLAQRHDIRVQLRPGGNGGTTCLVMLPTRVTRHEEHATTGPDDGPLLRRPAPVPAGAPGGPGTQAPLGLRMASGSAGDGTAPGDGRPSPAAEPPQPWPGAGFPASPAAQDMPAEPGWAEDDDPGWFTDTRRPGDAVPHVGPRPPARPSAARHRAGDPRVPGLGIARGTTAAPPSAEPWQPPQHGYGGTDPGNG